MFSGRVSVVGVRPAAGRGVGRAWLGTSQALTPAPAAAVRVWVCRGGGYRDPVRVCVFAGPVFLWGMGEASSGRPGIALKSPRGTSGGAQAYCKRGVGLGRPPSPARVSTRASGGRGLAKPDFLSGRSVAPAAGSAARLARRSRPAAADPTPNHPFSGRAGGRRRAV